VAMHRAQLAARDAPQPEEPSHGSIGDPPRAPVVPPIPLARSAAAPNQRRRPRDRSILNISSSGVERNGLHPRPPEGEDPAPSRGPTRRNCRATGPWDASDGRCPGGPRGAIPDHVRSSEPRARGPAGRAHPPRHALSGPGRADRSSPTSAAPDRIEGRAEMGFVRAISRAKPIGGEQAALGTPAPRGPRLMPTRGSITRWSGGCRRGVLTCFGRIDRCIGEPPCARRCRRTDPRSAAVVSCPAGEPEQTGTPAQHW
jgi:hypothetical protein